MGECGLRGGYFEAHNMSQQGKDMLYKMKSIELCGNTIGQIALTLMIDPPQKGIESDACVDEYNQEKDQIFYGLKDRA